MDIEFGKLASAAMPLYLSAIVSALVPLGLDERAIQYDGDFPNLSGLRLNLTGAHFHRETSLQDIADGEPDFTVRKVTANAAPAYFEALPFIFAMQAEDAAFSSKLVLIRSGKGTLDLSASIADIESALLNYVRSAAEKQGAEAECVNITLTPEGSAAISIRVTATAKAMFFRATLTITARIEITETLEIRLSSLVCNGDGMLANLAAAALRTKLAVLDGRAFALHVFIPKLKTLTLDASNGLKFSAVFGD